MSVIYADHANSAPYRFTNLSGEMFTYSNGSAEQASDWSEKENFAD